MHKQLFLAIAVSMLSLAACTNSASEETNQKKNTSNNSYTNDAIPAKFLGKWERTFFPVPGKPHKVSYIITPDSMFYSVSGEMVNANYTLEKDVFDAANNKFIGHNKAGNYFVAFFKQAGDSISIFKEPIASKEKGIAFEPPAANYKANHNQGWNLYGKNN